MYLALQITSPQAAAMLQNASKVFGESGGTIGRSAGNDWVLPDEERYVSSRHVIIRYMGGMFSLEDVSTNGTFINGQPNAVGAENEPAILKNGDQIQIGDYLIYASVVEGDSAAAQPAQAAPAPPLRADPVVTSPTHHPTSPTFPGSSTLGPIDPLVALGPKPAAPPPGPPPSVSDHSPATSDYFRPPGVADTGGTVETSGIPDDWDLTDYSAASSRRPTAAQVPPQAAIPAPGNTGVSPGPTGKAAPVAAGSSTGNALFDQLFPIIVQGMMDVLKSRAEIKSQFRLSLTTIKPVENNPLKFSPNVEDAMGHLFDASHTGYLKPAEAFEEGFNDIKAHELAMMAGMRAAFEHMLKQFSPKVLEDHFEGGRKRGKLMGMANKVRYWEMYRDMFDRMTRDSDDNFRTLFGEEFAAAYEEQMRSISR